MRYIIEKIMDIIIEIIHIIMAEEIWEIIVIYQLIEEFN